MSFLRRFHKKWMIYAKFFCSSYFLIFILFFKSDAGLSFGGATSLLLSLVVGFCGLIWPFLLCHQRTFTIDRIRSLDLSVQCKLVGFSYCQILNAYQYGRNMLSCNLEIFAKIWNRVYYRYIDLIQYFSHRCFWLQICNSSCSYYVIFRRFTQR